MTLQYVNIFLDRITISSLIKILSHSDHKATLHYFESCTREASFLVCWLNKLGWNLQPQKVPFYFHDVRDNNDKCLFREVLKEAFDVTRAIQEKEIARDQLLNSLAAKWHRKKLELYLFNQIREEVKLECLRIVMARWMLDKEQKTGQKGLLFIERNDWIQYLKDYARDKDILLLTYRSLIPKSLRLFLETYPISKVFKRGTTLLSNYLRRLIFRDKTEPVSVAFPFYLNNYDSSNYSVAMQYGYRKLSFDPGERSEFFWLNASDLPYNYTILYHYTSFVEPDPELDKALNLGIRVYGRGKGSLKWTPSSLFLKNAFTNFRFVLRCALENWRMGHSFRLSFLTSFLLLGIKVAYWKLFFENNKIRVKISANSVGSVSQVLALDELDGVSAAYQYSIAVMNSPYSVFSCGENIQFVFSGMFEKLWQQMDIPVEAFFHTGYLDDYAIETTGNNSSMQRVRNELKAAGADFIICFFDENSNSVWYQHAPNEAACKHYEYLLRWLLDDPKLGLVFKPKQSLTLFKRLRGIECLIEKGMATKRCRFLTSNTVVGSIFPAEVALVSDICLGILFGATSSLEAFLSGKPAVLFDPEKNENHPFYRWGKDTVVFSDWNLLQNIIQKYRKDPASQPNLGNWSPAMGEIDPFQDGLANQRVGKVVWEIWEALNSGLNQNQAIYRVMKKSKREWENST